MKFLSEHGNGITRSIELLDRCGQQEFSVTPRITGMREASAGNDSETRNDLNVSFHSAPRFPRYCCDSELASVDGLFGFDVPFSVAFFLEEKRAKAKPNTLWVTVLKFLRLQPSIHLFQEWL